MTVTVAVVFCWCMGGLVASFSRQHAICPRHPYSEGIRLSISGDGGPCGHCHTLWWRAYHDCTADDPALSNFTPFGVMSLSLTVTVRRLQLRIWPCVLLLLVGLLGYGG